MHATAEQPHSVCVVADDAAGESIKRRRTALGMTVKALAELAGVDRGRLAAIEDGATARASTIGAIESTLTRLEEEMGMDVPATPGDLIEFDISGDFGVHLIVKGPVADAEVLKRQVVDIIREMRKSQDDTPDSAG